MNIYHIQSRFNIVHSPDSSRGVNFAFSALTLLVGRQEGHPACKKMGGWQRWALVSPDGVAPSRTVGVSASVNLPLHHKVISSLLAPAHPGGPGKTAVKRLWCGGDSSNETCPTLRWNLKKIFFALE